MISISYRDPRPIYEQVRDSLRALVISGVLSPGDRLPSVRELAGELAINPNTIQRAYRELEREGFIVSVSGKGSFICESNAEQRERRDNLLRSFVEIASELQWLGVSREELCERLKGGRTDAVD